MSLVVSIASPSSFPELVRLFNEAFHDDTSMILRGEDAKSQQSIDEAVLEYKQAQQHKDCYHVVVTDTKLGKIIGFARWRMYPNGYEPENLDTMDNNAEAVDNARNYEIGFLTKTYEERQRLWKDKPVCFLDILATDPVHQKRGAATLLMEWGINKADALGIPTHLEASDSSKTFYEHRGFKKMGQINIDLSQYGLEGEEIIAIMNRDSRPAV